ncbi:3-isopropylmalate dehydrogenase [Leclercia adecarboxylata]|uniref:3-isopropylmalate dehydrogenase n=1 Tax=Leclercia adecarboxylata TaxID=83655 RepID=A0A4U9HJ73_9ENTR|nr:3-isopropylmalate dehydrogenase [Leclercia adecarboxylata]
MKKGLACTNRQAAQHRISRARILLTRLQQILSLALLLRYSLDANDAATAIENAINRALEEGIRTGDLARGAAAVTTDEMGDIICPLCR